jgi:hypothetical protein
MSDLLTQRGSQLVTRDQLDLVPLPEETESYIPVPHYHLAGKILSLTGEILKDYTLAGETYAVSRSGNQLFALLNFRREHNEIGLSVAFRNSYDKSMSLGIAVGGQVFICDNLMLYGEIAVMKKHTKNVWIEFEDIAIASLYKSQRNFEKVVADSEKLKGLTLKNDDAYRLMGLLYGHGVVSPRQLTALKAEWLRPSHPEFSERNKWAFFNATTEALKSTPPVCIMEKHIEAYREIVEE